MMISFLETEWKSECLMDGHMVLEIIAHLKTRYLHSWQKAASLLIQHLYSPPLSLHFVAKSCSFRRSQSFAQTVASSEELRT